ncbi:hypothetical protein ACHQM5_011742 [Ranunculus cassubicifolius]
MLNEFDVDGMEGKRDEMANSVTEGVYWKGEEENRILMEPLGMAISSTMLPQSSLKVSSDNLEDGNANANGDGEGFMMEELTVRINEKSKVSSISGFTKVEGAESRKVQWKSLYNPAGGSGSGNHGDGMVKENGTTDGGEDSRWAVRPDFCRPQLPPSRQSNQIHASDSLINNRNSTSENVFSPRDIPTNPTNPTTKSGFSQFFAKNASKDKGVTTEVCDSLDIGAMGQKEMFENYSAETYNRSLRTLHEAFTSTPTAIHGGINLREWLKPGSRKVNKAESLHMFKQIVKLVDVAHSQQVALQDLRASSFELLPSNRVKYIGSLVSKQSVETATDISTSYTEHRTGKKRSMDHNAYAYNSVRAKHQKLGENVKFPVNNNSGGQRLTSIDFQFEDKWYTSPEVLSESGSTFSSNIYSLGVLLFELLCNFGSVEAHRASMSDLRHRILPPSFLSENPSETGFCLLLLHPKPSSRPTTRDILQSEILNGSQALPSKDQLPRPADEDGVESELLSHFLATLQNEKEKRASQLVKDLRCLEADLEEVSKRYLSRTGEVFAHSDNNEASSLPSKNNPMLTRNITQLESAYFSSRAQMQFGDTNTRSRPDKDLILNRDGWSSMQTGEGIEKPADRHGVVFDGLCKYARYSKIEQRSVLRNVDLLNSGNVICSLSFDRDEDYFATAGVSKKIKIFEFDALLNDSIDIHYPVIEMTNKSRLTCVCWNNYIKNYLASTDYAGDVQLWDASTGQVFSQLMEHEKRTWSADFSQLDPKKLASGSDDGLVKIWNIDEQNSVNTIKNIANICCVQFSAHSSNLLAFGSSDYKTYCYDLRNTRIPWCTLAGHGKAVSYVKFLDSATLVSASTDNTLKLWDLNKTSSNGVSTGACGVTFEGHTNEKNFVGLSVYDGYIACGSETNEVYTYHRSLPMPITSYNFGSIDPISGKEIEDDNGQFVSSVCWRGKSNMIVTANSTGSIKLLELV